MKMGWRETTIGEATAFTSKPRGLDLGAFDRVPFVPMELIPQGNTCVHDWTWKPGKDIRSGNYNLRSFQTSEIVYDGTVIFCDRFVSRRSRTHDQMVQAARSGRQNIAEGSMASATSKKTELKLTNVAKASLEELLLDFEDFLRQQKLLQWDKNSPEALAVRKWYRGFPAKWFAESNLSDKSDVSDRSELLDPYGIATAFGELSLDNIAPPDTIKHIGCKIIPNCTPKRLKYQGLIMMDSVITRDLMLSMKGQSSTIKILQSQISFYFGGLQNPTGK